MLLPTIMYSQDNNSTGISGFFVPERNSLNIGFTSFDLHYRLASREKFALDYGLRFIGATTGRRGGYFAFGYFSELILRPTKRFQPGFNAALLAGGGAEAPDNDGWMAQGTLFTQYQFKSGLNLRAGLNYAFVSGGDISGFSPLIGLNWKLRTMSNADSLSRSFFAWNAVYGEFGIGVYDDKELGFIGAGAKLTYGRHFSGDVIIHALTNTYGGYMQVLLSGGPDFSIGSFHMSPALILGLGGGGAVRTKGGGLYGAQLGFYHRGERFHVGLKYRFVEAVSKEFGYNGLFASIGKTLQPDRHSPIRWDLVTKAYIGKEGFGNIGARFTAFEYRKLRLMGSTYWAFTNGKGAYAEGLFEASLSAPGSWPFYLVTSFGAGAGSGINQKTASLIYAAGVGYASPLRRLPFNLECAYWEGGNIPHWSFAFSYHIGK
jgi:hypothetical protein